MKRLLLLSLLLIIFTTKYWAQVEVQVSPDAEGKLEYITSDQEKRLNLFSEYKNFIEARCFQLTDTSFAIEISYKENGVVKRAKKYYNSEAFMAFRNNVTSLISQNAPETILNQEGRSRLLTVSTAVGLTYYGWALPTAMNVEDGKLFLGMYMLSAGTSFFLPYAITRKQAVSPSQADLFIYGQTRGILHGNLINLAIMEESDPTFGSFMGMSFSIAEGVIGYHWARKEKMTRGDALTIGLWGDFGMGIFAGTSYTLGFLETNGVRRLSATTLLGAATGITFGNYMRKKYTYTAGDVYMQRSLGFLGAYVPVAISLIGEVEDAKVVTGVAALGSIGGLTLGHYIAQNNDYTAGQGRLIALGQTAGGLVGLGAGYLISSENDNAYKVWLGGSVLGSVGGFILMNKLFANRKVKSNEKKHAFNFSLNPQGFIGLNPKASTSDPALAAPMVYASFRF
ncbi:MAG: hypothetical protein C0599_01940 [Salinivirgaceae bacterium]|nr:MAG: hypothetical protein C0599_01940 [Salinivirgaceae bacterium]